MLEEFGVTMIGATADAIDKAEDRRRFDIAMKKIGLDTARFRYRTHYGRSAGGCR
ncbi:carbamoyl-phosphate synthase large chain [Salmonella enterica subsp. enterica]|uniref:Carbamoyl-phosphate synthase large chain n=1 Tax=Salmonella enterica I TaxID=59201 RepID=A0A447PTX7_SALET|nr:carbamoyl-phosphate synthase large chain [Salmonella enterica subsp. enterica]